MKVFVTGGSGFVGQNLIKSLIAGGYEVVALARSANSVKIVEQLGAKAVRGGLSDAAAIAKGLHTCDSVFHLAAEVSFFKSEKSLSELNVNATWRMLKEAQKQGVKNFIYLSAASVAMNGSPVCMIDETYQSNNIIDGYSKTKHKAEQLVLNENKASFRTIAFRPSLIWGKGESHLLPALTEAVKKNRFKFIDGGNHFFISCHAKNVCHALMLGEKAEIGGETFFITDDEQITIKEFLMRYLKAAGVTIPDVSISYKKAWFVANVLEAVWKLLRLKGEPPLTKATVYATGMEFTASDAKARMQLGYKPVVSYEQGFKEMTEERLR